MKIKSSLLALVAVLAFIGISNAQEQGSSHKAEMAGKSCQGDSCDGACPIQTAMGELPKMNYKVGEETTCCFKSAAELAKQNSQPIHYLVAEKTYDQKEAAYASLVTQTEEFVNKYVTPCKCEKSGTTTIAGKACGCSVMAGQRTELVKAAVDKVQMSYMVGEKACNCTHEADALAKSGEAKKFYVVGEEKTCCEMTGRLNLARAKYKAAVQAIAAADAQKAKAESPKVGS